MTTAQILKELQSLGSESTKKTLLRHGAREPFYGVKIEDLKKVQKKIKDNQQVISQELYASGIGDAQYLAALLAHGSLMNNKQLQTWVETAGWHMISEYSVPWVTAENEQGWKIALKWIDSSKETIAAAGWCTLSSIVTTWSDDKLNIATIEKLFIRIEKEIETSPNRVKYCMNGFVIAAGSYVKAITPEAIATGKKIGSVKVDMGDTACKVPFAPDYIQKIIDKGNHGKKKKTAKC